AGSPVAAGDSTPVTGSGWVPESEVALQLTDADGNPVGDPVTVTADAEGNIPEGTELLVPEGTEPGEYTVVGTDENGAEATAPVTVTEAGVPALEAGSPVAAGDSTPVTGSGWVPESEVTLQLTNADGNPVGDPVTVTTDAEGNIPEGTELLVPEGTEPGEYTVVGTDENGA
ncbi:hypothetical protein, partial [Cumulibacter soli]|uniref:hypothetical protein n=1 Tax=Cumulibacter soli TaxID=2546344 RepID=UPI001ABA9476